MVWKSVLNAPPGYIFYCSWPSWLAQAFARHWPSCLALVFARHLQIDLFHEIGEVLMGASDHWILRLLVGFRICTESVSNPPP
ncbi:hypothetical protein SDJN03_11830, partial [Cucurbita argyrosperma subsp. sororia]